MRQDGVLHFAKALLPEGWRSQVSITLADGLIKTVEPDAQLPIGAEHYGVAIPGMPNLHSHAFQRAMAGLAEYRSSDGDDFWSWRDLMYRLAGTIDPDQLRKVAAMAQIEMLESGFTRVGEFHYLHHDVSGGRFGNLAEMSNAIFAAAWQTGIAVTHLPVFYAHGGFNGAPPTEAQARFVCDLDEFSHLLERCREGAADLPDAVVGLAPHSLRAVTPQELSALEDLAGNGPIHIHIAEQVREVADCRAALGTTPVRWLLDNARVGSRWCLVHATHVDVGEVSDMAGSGAVVGLCPVTEANLGDGVFPAQAFMEAGGRFGIGSDSNVRIDMAEELRVLEYGQRLHLQARNIMTSKKFMSNGRSLLECALHGGWQALGLDGGIRPGASADLVALREDVLVCGAQRDDALIDHLIFSAGSRAIDSVWRRGRLVVSGGRHVMRDQVEGEYRAVLKALIA